MTPLAYSLAATGIFAIVAPLAWGLYLWHCERREHKGSNLKGPIR